MATIARHHEEVALAVRSTAVDRGFPGNVVTGFCMLVAPLMLLVATLLELDIYNGDAVKYVHAMGAHTVRTNVGFNLVLGGLILLIFAVVGLSGMITEARPGLGRVAGILTVAGILGPVFFNGVYYGAFKLAGGSGEATAADMVTKAQVIPSDVINLTGPALLIGFIVLAVAARKAGVLGRWQALALGCTALLPIGFISGFLVIATIGFVGTTIALAPLGLRLLRGDGEPASVS